MFVGMSLTRFCVLVALAAACSSDTTSAAHTPVRVVFLTVPANTSVNNPIPGGVAIGVVDGTGTVRTDATSSVVITIGNNPGGAALSGTTTVNAVNGIATFDNLTLDKSGTAYTLVANSTGLKPDTSDAFNVTP